MTKNKDHRSWHRPKNAPANFMPAGFEGAELDARRAERLETMTVLKTSRTPLNIIKVADQATLLAEQTLADAKKAYPPPHLACQEGCDWCCHLTVGTAVPEVARIMEYLRQTLSADDLQKLRERIVQLAKERRDLKKARRGEPRLPCVFLVDHRCSIYPVRPLMCRGSNSRDARQCQLFLDPSNKAVIPMYVPQHRLAAFILDGMRAGLTASGLKGDLLELTAALSIAFETPDALERWSKGEAVFATARNE